jgi:hypothetical protein
MPFLDTRIDLTQVIDMADQEVVRSVGERHCEEKDAALDFGAVITRHAANVIKEQMVGKGARGETAARRR